MTPFEVNLRHDLDKEFVRMDHEWFFQWHRLSWSEHGLDVENFPTGRIQIGGVQFWGSPQMVYWAAVSGYLTGKVHEVYGRWDEETKGYVYPMRVASLGGTAQALREFVARILGHAIETDRQLRGKGDPKSVDKYDPMLQRERARAAIEGLRASHLRLIDETNRAAKEEEPEAIPERVEGVLQKYKGIVGLGSQLAGPAVKLWRAIFG